MVPSSLKRLSLVAFTLLAVGGAGPFELLGVAKSSDIPDSVECIFTAKPICIYEGARKPAVCPGCNNFRRYDLKLCLPEPANLPAALGKIEVAILFEWRTKQSQGIEFFYHHQSNTDASSFAHTPCHLNATGVPNNDLRGPCGSNLRLRTGLDDVERAAATGLAFARVVLSGSSRIGT